MTRRLQPDVALLDLVMPALDAATRLISAELPQVKVVILTASEDEAKLFEAIKAGAQGYLLKNLESKEFFALLEGLERGEPALTPAMARRLLQEFAHPQTAAAPSRDPDELNQREQEVLELLVQGITSSRKLARHLGLTEYTVKFHIRNILDKLHRTTAPRRSPCATA